MKLVGRRLRQEIAAKAEKLGVPGVAVGVYINGVEDYVFHGVTSVENPLPVEEATLFQVGSTGKTFTAAAMMRLVEAKKVALDDPVRKHLPGLKLRDESAARRVTILQLMNHTAGWNGDYFEDTGDGDDALARYVRKMRKLRQLFPPGSEPASYNNAAVALAGRVIEKVTGLTYEQAIKDLVLDPVGLEHSFFGLNDVMTRRFVAGHSEEGGKVQVVRPWKMMRASNPMGGLVSTAGDQVKWARFHLGDGRAGDGKRVLRRRTLELMRKPTARLPVALGDNVGISWLMRDIGGVQMVGHGGTTPGQLSAFQMVPERDFAITILTNASAGGELHRGILRWALEAYLGVIQAEPEPLRLGARELKPYAGRYKTDGGVLVLKVSNDHLDVTMVLDQKTLTQLKESGREAPPAQPPIPIKLLPADVFVVIEGAASGSKGEFARSGDRITGVNFGGRLAPRIA
ncbi:MAG: serine hydrolase domain-containing protein [Candidatus Dormibacteria bacterium]